MNLKRIIANNIYILRNEYGLTQKEFADKLNINITRGQISHIENADNMPSAEFIDAVSKAFSVSADWLLKSNITTPGPKVNLTSDDIDVALKYHNLPSKIKSAIKKLIDSINN